jgi:fatty-acyl-CoA synthase
MEARHLKHWPKHLARHLTVPETTLYANLEISALRYPDKPALIFFDSRTSYLEFKRQVDVMAGFLQSRCGVRKGDRVLMQMQNSPQFAIAYYAILRADAAVLPVSPMHVTDELLHYFEDGGVSTCFVAQDLYPQIKPLMGKQAQHAIVATYADYLTDYTTLTVPEFLREPRHPISDPGVISWADAMSTRHNLLPARANADDLAAVLYTSGTTGKSKGCTHTHRTMMTTLVGAALWEGFTADSVALSTAPMFHVTGMQHTLNTSVYSGATIAILPRWNPDAAGYMIEHYGCTHWANVPTMVADLLAHPSTAGRNLSSLQNIFGGGAAMPEAVAQKLFDLCGIRYMEAYGMTETISQTHINPHGDLRKQCLGIPTFDTEAMVIDPETLAPLGPNELGEIVMHGPQLMKGYWQRPEATAEVFIQIEGKTFLRSGDLGRYDEDGFYYMADRLKRMINASGFKVWPAEVEATLYKHPDIKEVAVISSPDTRRGETVKAVVVLKDERKGQVSADDIMTWSRAHMAAYKVPRRVQFSDALPRSGAGKIQWRLLQEQEWKHSDEDSGHD